MANSTQPHPPDAHSPAGSGGAPTRKDQEMAFAERLVLELSDHELRENALSELSKKKELYEELGPFMWNSFGTIALLLQEIVSIYPFLSPPNLIPARSARACNAISALRIVASHPDTRMLFVDAHIPLYLYPFLNTTSQTQQFEFLRIASLGVIGTLVKAEDTGVISYLLLTGIMPFCLRNMEIGGELSKTVATFIVQKILSDDGGLEHIGYTGERFHAVNGALANMLAAVAVRPSPTLLKHTIRCYLRLSHHPRANMALKQCLPDILRDARFGNYLREDPTTREWLRQLLHNVGIEPRPIFSGCWRNPGI